jgi:hypothetical protein
MLDCHGGAGGVVGVDPAVAALLLEASDQHERHLGVVEVGDAFVVVGQVGHDEAGDLALLPQLLVVGGAGAGFLTGDKRLQPKAGRPVPTTAGPAAAG